MYTICNYNMSGRVVSDIQTGAEMACETSS